MKPELPCTFCAHCREGTYCNIKIKYDKFNPVIGRMEQTGWRVSCYSVRDTDDCNFVQAGPVRSGFNWLLARM